MQNADTDPRTSDAPSSEDASHLLSEQAVSDAGSSPEPPAGFDASARPEAQGNASTPAHAATIAPATEQSDAEALLALKSLEARRRKKRRSRNLKIVAAVAVVALLGGAWWATHQPEQPEDVAPEPETYMVYRDDFSTSVQASGSLQPASLSTVSPEVDGTVQEIRVKEGQRVKKGDVIFVMRSPELDKAVDEASQALNAANDDVSEAQAALRALQKEYDDAVAASQAEALQADQDRARAQTAGEQARQQAYDKAIAAIPEDATKDERDALFEQAEADAQDAYDKAYAAVEIAEVIPVDEDAFAEEISAARSAITTAQEAVGPAQEAYDQAVAETSKCTVTAPKGGVVLSVTGEEGKTIGGSDDSSAGDAPVAKIADLTKMKVSVEVNEIDISDIAKDQRAIVTFSAFPDLEQEAVVADVATTATGSEDGGGGGFGDVVTFKVDLVIDDPDSKLKPGMTASVEILTQDVQDAIVVPLSAFVEDDEQTATVQVVVDPDTLQTEERTVSVGVRSASQAVIEDGLAEGEEILLGGMFAGDDEGFGDEDEEDGGIDVGMLG